MNFVWSCGKCKTQGDVEAEGLPEALERAKAIHRSYSCSDRVGVFPAGDGRDKPDHDPVNAPLHYRKHPTGIEPVVICEHMTFNVGNAIKYLMRHAHKGNAAEDCRKAAWYCTREAERLEKERDAS